MIPIVVSIRHKATFIIGVCVCVRVCVRADCPQVQCVEQYVAQQTDELSLEPTEIINVLRKTNEGTEHAA